ncbi:MAG: hypothetical protein Q7W30_07365 [Coriobacteriia bacterium]|nr:hypothetical protein [Coriobacteriia bacterium]
MVFGWRGRAGGGEQRANQDAATSRAVVLAGAAAGATIACVIAAVVLGVLEMVYAGSTPVLSPQSDPSVMLAWPMPLLLLSAIAYRRWVGGPVVARAAFAAVAGFVVLIDGLSAFIPDGGDVLYDLIGWPARPLRVLLWVLAIGAALAAARGLVRSSRESGVVGEAAGARSLALRLVIPGVVVLMFMSVPLFPWSTAPAVALTGALGGGIVAIRGLTGRWPIVPLVCTALCAVGATSLVLLAVLGAWLWSKGLQVGVHGAVAACALVAAGYFLVMGRRRA